MLRLSQEELDLFLTCKAYLQPSEEQQIRTLAAQPVNWAYVLWRAENNRTIPVLEYHLKRLNLLSAVPAEIRAYLTQWTVFSRLRSALEFRNLIEIIDALDREESLSFWSRARISRCSITRTRCCDP